MTIDVPPHLAAKLDELTRDLAKELGDPVSPAQRRLIEVAVLTRGVAAMRGPKGEIVMVVKNDRGGIR